MSGINLKVLAALVAVVVGLVVSSSVSAARRAHGHPSIVRTPRPPRKPREIAAWGVSRRCRGELDGHTMSVTAA